MWIMRFSQKIFMEMKDMKKVISLITALVLCFTMACSVFAVESFVPSISMDNYRFVVPVNETVTAVIRNAKGEAIDFVGDDCLIVITIAQALDKSVTVPEDMRQELIEVYDALNDGTMKLPYDKLDTKYKAKDFEIRDLAAAQLCEYHTKLLAEEGVTIDITFDLGVGPNEDVYVMTYINEEWDPIVKVVNNGDGTVTCTFEELCPISFSVAEKPLTAIGLLQRMLNFFKAHIERLIK